MFFDPVQINFSQNKYGCAVWLRRDWLMDVTWQAHWHSYKLPKWHHLVAGQWRC